MGNALLLGWNATSTETWFKNKGRDLRFWENCLTLLSPIALKHLRLGSQPELVDPQAFAPRWLRFHQKWCDLVSLVGQQPQPLQSLDVCSCAELQVLT